MPKQQFYVLATFILGFLLVFVKPKTGAFLEKFHLGGSSGRYAWCVFL